jgi:hypothetical protein
MSESDVKTKEGLEIYSSDSTTTESMKVWRKNSDLSVYSESGLEQVVTFVK